MSIGERLKQARKEKGLSLKEIQNDIKIRTRYLEALESDNYNLIPGEAYVRAFIKSYANRLGLQSEELLEEYRIIKEEEKKLLEEEEEKTTKPSIEFFQNKALISSIIIAVIILIFAILIYNVVLLNNSRNEEVKVSQQIDIENQDSKPDIDQFNLSEDDEIIPEFVKKDEDNNPEKEMNSLISDSSHDPIFVEEPSKNLDIIVIEKSWLQIYADGDKVYEGILDEGTNKSIFYRNNISMKIGNAAGIQVRKNNQLLGPWGKKGEVIEKIIN